VAIAALALALVLAATLRLAERRFESAGDAVAERLRASAARPSVPRYDPSELEGLPAPVSRYLRAVLRAGQPIVTRARIEWRGEFNMGRPGQDRWRPFTAHQEFVPNAPGFVWNARVAMAPGVPVLVRDGFAFGEGSMHAAVFGLVKVADVAGTKAIAAAALQRYLGEALCFPTALLPSQRVGWTPIDDRRARASLEAGGTKVALEFRFGPDDLVAEVFAPDRSYDDGRHPPVPRPWRARLLRYAERQGTQVPVDAVVEWQLPEGDFPYWRGQPLSIRLD
jgi:hypothetical protein